MPWNDVEGRVEGRIDPSTPWIRAAVAHRRQLEIERLPIGVQDQVEEESFLPQLRADRHTVRMLAPIRLSELDAVPSFVRLWIS